MRVFGLAGWSGAGKTTLLSKLIPALTAQGLRVSTLKHAHHAFDLDTPGKDSWVHRQSGATEVTIVSANRYAIMHELRGSPEPTIEEILPRLAPVDLLLIEGFKRHKHDKLEIHRPALGKALLSPHDPDIVAVASDAKLANLAVPLLDLNDIDAIAAFVRQRTGLG
ncbi:MAG: molybdopterin-guanine dinucleotide biosynthesis protein B [Alphaproteobacteria bacterium]|nr:molybdopterin-guanine dinucleotide biosynthesis protein B [Alphaproteobacteria bacterium]